MTDIDTLLTLDADDPALRRGIAELLGWHGFIALDGILFGHEPGMPLGTVKVFVPDWPHSVDAALTLLPPLPSAIIISRVIEGWYVGINTMSSRLRDISEGRSDNLALAICRAWLASKR